MLSVLTSNSRDIRKEFDSYIEQIEELYLSLNNNTLISNQYKYDLQSELKFSLVIKSTGFYEKFFDSLINEFSKNVCCLMFYKYFRNNFSRQGKAVKPDNINRIFDTLDIQKLGKGHNDCLHREFISLNSMYEVRDSIAHGDMDNFSQDFSEFIINSRYAFQYIEQEIVRVLEEKLNENNLL